VKIKTWNFHIKNAFGFQFNADTGRSVKKILKKVHRREKKFSENSFRKKEVVKEIYTKKKKSPAAAYRKSILCSLLKVLASHTHISGGGAQ
jgi:ribosomal protein S12